MKKIEQIDEEIVNCELCPVDQRFQHELGWGTHGKIMFIGQCPSYTNKTGAQGTSDFDKFFLKLISEAADLTIDDFYFTNLVKIPVDIKTISDEDLDHCATHVIDEIETTQPKMILCLGKYSYQTMKRAALKGLSPRVYSILHPAAIRYGTMTGDQWKEEFKTLLTKLNVLKTIGKE